MDKFRETGSMKIKEGRGRNGLILTKAKKIKRLGMEKLFTGTRPIAMKVGCSKTTVAGAKKAYHRRKDDSRSYG